MDCDLLIEKVRIVDGSGATPQSGNVAIREDRIVAISNEKHSAHQVFDGRGYVLAPGFIDVHTHDDLYLIRAPQMLPKLSQGVTTVIVGNCGISAAPVVLKGSLPDPMNLLGQAREFSYPSFSAYVKAIVQAKPAV